MRTGFVIRVLWQNSSAQERRGGVAARWAARVLARRFPLDFGIKVAPLDIVLVSANRRTMTDAGRSSNMLASFWRCVGNQGASRFVDLSSALRDEGSSVAVKLGQLVGGVHRCLAHSCKRRRSFAERHWCRFARYVWFAQLSRVSVSMCAIGREIGHTWRLCIFVPLSEFGFSFV